MKTGRPRIYSINHSFFSTPNIKNCQWAGYLAADGTINEKIGSLKVACQSKDLEIIESFRRDVQCDYPIRETKARLSNGKIYLGWEMTIRSRNMIEDLNNVFGIHGRKSFSLCPPYGLKDDQLMLAYFVGLVNGDGSIWRDGARNIVQFSISGTMEICQWCRDIYSKFEPLKGKHIYKNGSVYSFMVGNVRAVNFLKSISKMDVYYLSRKWDILDTPDVTVSGKVR